MGEVADVGVATRASDGGDSQVRASEQRFRVSRFEVRKRAGNLLQQLVPVFDCECGDELAARAEHRHLALFEVNAGCLKDAALVSDENAIAGWRRVFKEHANSCGIRRLQEAFVGLSIAKREARRVHGAAHGTGSDVADGDAEVLQCPPDCLGVGAAVRREVALTFAVRWIIGRVNTRIGRCMAQDEDMSAVPESSNKRRRGVRRGLASTGHQSHQCSRLNNHHRTQVDVFFRSHSAEPSLGRSKPAHAVGRDVDIHHAVRLGDVLTAVQHIDEDGPTGQAVRGHRTHAACMSGHVL